ncbi:phycobiliprotein lyase [Geitlerinema sp. PCC 9228]|jgi:hypothetical protein|uniref:phycobiliprotein lyase n=1 Tax=Geitlerinema sp. PCC 9228 TaxID=111611 RepID=UPI0008F9B5AC|nr:phycobiliprotein lyase [Geitlerinema sp. PCC 9228]
MSATVQSTKRANEQQIADFFRQSQGQWYSQRRYYTLPDGQVQEVASKITVRFLEAGAPQLQQLAQLHQLENPQELVCGAEIAWESNYTLSGRKASSGSTIFGAAGNILYRDRGFATSKPVTATFYFLQPNTLCLKTEYQGSVFEEEIKQISHKYRTRQTIISRAGEQQMVGQYLEKRIS